MSHIPTVNCDGSKPLIEYNNNGASTLNYRVPQRTAFKLYGKVEYYLDPQFLIGYTTPEEDSFWNMVNFIPANALKEIVTGIVTNPNDPNRKFLFNHFDLLDQSTAITVFIDKQPASTANAQWVSIDGQQAKIVAVKWGTTANSTTQFTGPAYATNSGTQVGSFTGSVQLNNSTMQGLFTPVQTIQYPVGTQFIDINMLVQQFKAGKKAFFSSSMQGKVTLKFFNRPNDDDENLYRLQTVFEYTVASYLGNYGAGQTISTYSLLPGEKTTITVKTFKSLQATLENSSNILDSFSESSSKEFEHNLNMEWGVTEEKGKSKSGGLSLSLSGSGKDQESGAEIGGSASGGFQRGSYQSTNTFTNTAVNTMFRHVNNSNSNRDVSVTEASSEQFTETEETSVVRELYNPNLSRTLNFVFRQLLQEYHVVTSVTGISFLLENRKTGEVSKFDIQELKDVLNTIIADETYLENVVKDIIDYTCVLWNYDNQPVKFWETVNLGTELNCLGSAIPAQQVTIKRKGLKDFYPPLPEGNSPENHPSWPPAEGFYLEEPGVIMNVSTYVLKTDSVIVDSLLGQGDALDCYNSHLQNEAVRKANLENNKVEIAINKLSDPNISPEEYAKLYRMIFSPESEARNINANLTISNFENSDDDN